MCRYDLRSDSDSHPEDVEVNDAIPPHLWNILPPNAFYLRNIMEFAGYQTRESVIRLKHPEELQKMFNFVIELYDVIEDKKGCFGIFASKTEKLRVLPGLEPTFLMPLKVKRWLELYLPTFRLQKGERK